MLTNDRRKLSVMTTVVAVAGWGVIGVSTTLAAKGGGGHGGGGGDNEGPPPTHSFVDLGTFSGSAGYPGGINASGKVVLNAAESALLIVPRDENPVDGIPDTWFVDDGYGNNALMIDLGVLNGLYSDATSLGLGINSAAQIVGISSVGPDNDRAFLITPDDSSGALEWVADDGSGGNALMTDLVGDWGAGAIAAGSNAADISDNGYVVGIYGAYYWESPDVVRAVLRPYIIAPERDPDGVPHTWFKDEGDPPDGFNDLIIDLGTTDPVNLPNGNATAVNNDGWVYGELMKFDSPVAWFLVIPEDDDGDGEPDTWFRDDNHDQANDLMYQLPAPFAALNDLGQVVSQGAVWQIDPATGAATLLYELEVIPTSLGEGGGGALNNAGGVVGSAFQQKGRWSSDRTYTPLYWQDGALYNLFDLMTNDGGIKSARAIAIDDEGRIVGTAVIDGQDTCYIAVPLPPAP